MNRGREVGVIMTVLTGLCALGLASSLSPAVDHVASICFGVLFGLLGLGMAAYIGREVVRELRFRSEMRTLDRRDAARTAVRVGVRR